MLGIVSKKPIDARILQEFRQLSENGKTPKDFGCEQASKRVGHPDGWGIACLAGDNEVYRRSPLKASQDPKFEEALREIGQLSSPPYVLVAHIRRASTIDTIAEMNNQPFRREFDGRVVFFAHNGEVKGYGLRDGRIDSHAYFERLLEGLGTEPVTPETFRLRLKETKDSMATEFPKKVSSLTFLMSDDDEIVAHRDARECRPYYSLHEAKGQDCMVVCSEVLSSVVGQWRLLRNDETVTLSVL